MSSNLKKPPIAPPAYRPQPVPRVLQRKQSTVKAAPVYRPQPKPVVQRAAKSIAPRIAGAPVPHRGAYTVQLQKKDAEKFAKTNGIKIKVSYATVLKYVNNSKNDHSLRRGLLDAWNRNANSSWTMPTPVDFVTTTSFKHRNNKTYKKWTKTTSGVEITTAFGTGLVSLRHSRGAPKVGSNKKNWGNTNMGDKYVDYLKALRSGGLDDSDIAEGLLNQDDSNFTSTLEKRGAAMMDTTVYIAEEWRKQGARKLYRAMLRSIVSGDTDFNDFMKDFKFIKSAQEGRKQIGRIQDYVNEDSELKDLPKNERRYMEELSDDDGGGYSSDEDMRDEKELKGKRLFAKKHSKK